LDEQLRDGAGGGVVDSGRRRRVFETGPGSSLNSASKMADSKEYECARRDALSFVAPFDVCSDVTSKGASTAEAELDMPAE
jgi:hypothetical protein